MNSSNENYQRYGLLQGGIDQLEHWDSEDAQNADENWRKSGMKGCSPLTQWATWHKLLPPLQAEYEAGDSTALFRAISYCHSYGLPLPHWCGKAVSVGLGKVERAEARGWDGVFGSPMKGRRLPDLKRERATRIPAVHTALESIDAGHPVEATLRQTANEYAISYELLRRWYFEHCKRYPITEELREDGYYRKRTGHPDSEFVKGDDLHDYPSK